MMSSLARVVDSLGSAAGASTDLPVPESPQARVENLEKLVATFMQKLQDQQDAIAREAKDGLKKEKSPNRHCIEKFNSR